MTFIDTPSCATCGNEEADCSCKGHLAAEREHEVLRHAATTAATKPLVGTSAAYLHDGVNDFGTPVSHFRCQTCGSRYTVCPAVPPERREQWQDCLADDCASYDIDRDPTYLFTGGPSGD